MKIKYSLLLLQIAFIYSCSNNFEDNCNTNIESHKDNTSSVRSYIEALAIAQNSISIIENNKEVTRGNNIHRTIDDKNSIVITNSSKGLTRLSNSSIDTLLYVFNFNDNQGFAVISASKGTEGLLAVTENGHFDEQHLTNKDGFNIFMTLAEKYVKEAPPKRILPQPFIQRKDSTYQSESYIGPYISVKWGQDDPYGRFFSNWCTGCAVTATAQIMTYYEYPSSLDLTYSGADISVQNLNWTDIKKHDGYKSEFLCEASEETHNAIGRLCKQLGTLSNTVEISPEEGSYTNALDVKIALSNLGYNTSDWENYADVASSLFSNIYYNRTMILSGRAEGESYGHSWILDGTYTYYYEHFSWTKMVEELDWVLDSHTVETHIYYHFNWGADGLNNGYFYGNVFNCSSVLMPDTNSNPLTENFNVNVKVLTVYH